MSDTLLSILAGGLAGALAGYVVLRLNRPAAAPSRAAAPDEPAVVATPEVRPANDDAVQAEEPPAKDKPAEAAPDSLPAALAKLTKELGEAYDAAGTPAQFAAAPSFQAAIAAFRRPEVTTEVIGQYAMGDKATVACAAFVALSERPDRQARRDAVLRRLREMHPYPLAFALPYLTSLEQRPPLGAIFAAAQWNWSEHSAMIGALQDYLARSAELGDKPHFGDALDRKPAPDLDDVTKALEAITHPFATELLAALKAWKDARIDRALLRDIGALWEPGEHDRLLVLPEGWKEAMQAALQALRRPRPRSLLVRGDPHVGKTTFITLIAQALHKDGWTVFAASGTEIQAGQSYIGELEGRIRQMIEALHARRKVVWVAGDPMELVMAGQHRYQATGILDQILPAITAGELILIGESSMAGSTRLFQARPSLRALLELVQLQPMGVEATATLARQVGERIATVGKLAVPSSAVDAAMELAVHYLGSEKLPGVAIELLKRAADCSLAAGETTLSADSVIATLSQISGLPATILNAGQRVDLGQIRAFFTRRVLGQDEAVGAIVDRIAMLKAGLTDPGKPIGVFLFAGPTGTGKTELAKTTAEFLFGSADRLVRLDMSEFQRVESVAKILGSSDGGADSLIERIRKQPFSVILLDEFEKAHPDCWDLFLQVFDDGRLSDAGGREADFRHCIIILTSNLGATLHRGSGLGFLPDPGTFAPEQVMKTVEQTFRPEFVNRLDKVIVFRQLSRALMRTIVHKELAAIEERRGLRERAWAVEWEASAIEFLLDRGFSPEMGARPLKRAIDQHLLAPLAATMVEHRVPEGDQFLFVRANGQAIEVEFVDPDAGSAESAPAEDDEGIAEHSLPAIILSPQGSSEERASLAKHWRQVEVELDSESWRKEVDALRLALADPAIWQRADRHRTFSRMELADRVAEAARTAEALARRYEATRRGDARAARELAGRLALQVWNVGQGLADFRTDAPVDALLQIEPVLLDEDSDRSQAAAWCQRLAAMYRQWAGKRRLRLRTLPSSDAADVPIMHITGFGAFHTLSAESGLHVLEEGHGEEAPRRLVARVGAVAGPREPGQPGTDARTAAARLLAALPAATSIVRRYRERPAPLVRDGAGWRSGRLSAVLDGDFDLVGALKRRESGRGTATTSIERQSADS